MVRKVFFAVLSLGLIATGVALKSSRTTCGTGCGEYDVKAYKQYKAKLDKVDFKQFGAPVAVCFQQGTDPLVMAAFQQAMEEAQSGAWPHPNSRYQLGTRWTGNQGDPFTIRWSFVPDGLSIPGGAGEPDAASTLFAGMDAKFGGNRALWISKFQQIFARWSQLTGLKYQYVTNGTDAWDDNAAWGQPGSATRGDVRIGMHPIDGASGILAYNFFPQNGDMVIDANENWGSATGDYLFLRNTLGHEHGHGIGLNHVCPTNGTKLMEPFLNTSFDGPQQDDIRAGNRGYGDALEPDNSIATASNQGTLNVGGSLTLGTINNAANATSLSIDADGEQDFFKITTTGSLRLTATVTPVGSVYQSGPQVGNCDTGASLNAQSQADLAIEVQNSAGSVLASASANGLAAAETVAVDLPGAGNYFVRVYETNAPSQSQLYRLNMSAGAPSGIISGRITFLDWVNPNASLPLTLTVRNASTNAVVGSVNTTTNSLGDYSATIAGLSAGTNYIVQADSLMWLRKSVNVTTPAGISVTGLNFSLFNGDVDGSGEVDAADLDFVIDRFGSFNTAPGFTFTSDPDGSGEVDAVDIDLVIANFGRVDN